MRDPVNEKNSMLYAFLHGVAAIAFRTVLPVRFHHPERARMDPPFVMIANHICALDPAVVAYPLKKTQAVFLAKKVLDKNRFVHWFMTHMNCVFIEPETRDLGAMRQCFRALKMGKPLVVFPEGTRFHATQMEEIQNGASFLILRGRVPVLPVYLDRKVRPFRITNAWYGDPIPVEDLLAEGVNAETCEQLNERMRETFRRMIREAEAEQPRGKRRGSRRSGERRVFRDNEEEETK